LCLAKMTYSNTGIVETDRTKKEIEGRTKPNFLTKKFKLSIEPAKRKASRIGAKGDRGEPRGTPKGLAAEVAERGGKREKKKKRTSIGGGARLRGPRDSN